MTRGTRLAMSGIALAALLAVVAVASHAHRPGGATPASTPHAPTLFIDYIASAMLVLFPIGAMVVIWAMAQGRHQKLLDKQTNWLHTLISIGIMCGLLAAAVYLNKDRLGQRLHIGAQTSHSSQGRSVTTSHPRKGATPAFHAQFRWVSAAVVGGIILGLVGAGLTVYIRKRRGGDAWAQEAELAAALDEVLADSLDDLRADPDPRRAVIRAYARMEQTFAAYGVPREESEAPLEYMERALDKLSVSAFAVKRMTQLFSRAKFSPHDVDASMKDQAIEALVGLRAELEHGRVAA